MNDPRTDEHKVQDAVLRKIENAVSEILKQSPELGIDWYCLCIESKHGQSLAMADTNMRSRCSLRTLLQRMEKDESPVTVPLDDDPILDSKWDNVIGFPGDRGWD